MKTTHVLTALALLFAAAPALADGDAHVEKRANVKPIATGASLLGTAYVLSVIPTIGADIGNNHYFDAMYVPVVGPFITVGQSLAQSGSPFGYFAAGVDALFIADGLVQVAGAALLVYGLASPKKVIVRDTPHFVIAPVLGKSMSGVGASFTF